MSALLSFVVAVGVAVLLHRWARWLAKRPNAPRFLRFLPSAIVVLCAVGFLSVAYGLIVSFGAVSGESVDPSQKARILAEGISEAMNCYALLGIVLLVIALGLGIATLRECRSGPS